MQVSGGIEDLKYTEYDLYLESSSHLSSSLQHEFDHIFASVPHLVALIHEVLAEAQPVDPVRAETGAHDEVVHAVGEVVDNDSVKIVCVSLESTMKRVTGS